VPGLSLSPSSGRMSSLLGMRLVEKGQSILRTPRRGIPTHASGAAAPGRGAPPGARLFVQQRTSINSTDASAKPARKRFVDWASRAFGAGSTTVAKRSRHPYRWRGGGAPPGCPTCSANSSMRLVILVTCLTDRAASRLDRRCRGRSKSELRRSKSGILTSGRIFELTPS
jgi:hypothetical protein